MKNSWSYEHTYGLCLSLHDVTKKYKYTKMYTKNVHVNTKRGMPGNSLTTLPRARARGVFFVIFHHIYVIFL